MVQKEMGTIDRRPLATLKDYAINYFRYLRNFASLFPCWQRSTPRPPLTAATSSLRQPSRDVNRQVMSRNASPEQLWLHSREPIRQPLLKKLLGNADLSHKACLAFTDILRHDMAFCTF